jgi:hypothetical protein
MDFDLIIKMLLLWVSPLAEPALLFPSLTI